jgi:hypothetical protein
MNIDVRLAVGGRAEPPGLVIAEAVGLDSGEGSHLANAQLGRPSLRNRGHS